MLQFQRQDQLRCTDLRPGGVTIPHRSDKAANSTDASMTATQRCHFSAQIKVLYLDANARGGG
jgi:hypothetical protein